MRGGEPTLDVERGLVGPGQSLACVDEVGRGALAGPVSVGLVIVEPRAATAPTGIRDSKDLSAADREALVDPVSAWVSASAVGHAAPQEIDAHGIVAALRLGGHRAWTTATAALAAAGGRPPSAVLLDGSHDWFTPQLLDALTHAPAEALTEVDVPVTTRVKADRDCAGVGAASILAKVERDAIMADLDATAPHFGWASNKGYGTAAHREAILVHGPSEHHRLSWNLTPKA